MTKLDHKKADETLARAIYASGTPLSITENKYWKLHYKQIRPAYELPSRYRLSNSLLDEEYERVQKSVLEKISQADSLTVLSDGWTDIQANPLINIVCATPEPVFLKAIATKSSHHTGKYIAKILSEEIENIGSCKVQALVTDNAKNMKSAWDILKERYSHLITFGCVAHGLDLLAKDITQLNTVKTILSHCKAIVKFFNNHHIPNQVFKKIQKEKQGKAISLKLPAETRWGSAQRCLDSLLRTKNSLQCTSLEEDVSTMIPVSMRKQILDDIFWVQVQESLNLLQPVSHAIKKLKGNRPAISEVPEIFQNLKQKLSERCPNSPFTKAEETLVMNIFNRRSEFCIHQVHLAANLLDPKYKGENLSEEELSSATDIILEIANSISGVSDVAIMTDLAEYRAKEKLWAREVIWKVAKNMAPITWWKGYCNTRQLSKIAIRILSIQ